MLEDIRWAKRQGIGMKTYLHGPMDYVRENAETAIFRVVGDLDHRRNRHTKEVYQ